MEKLTPSEGFRWIAQDEDGEVYGYNVDAKMQSTEWTAPIGCFSFIQGGKPNPNWKESKVDTETYEAYITSGILVSKLKGNIRNALFEHYGSKTIPRCKGTALENAPYLGVKLRGAVMSGHPRFDDKSERYEFMVAILEDKPVFVGAKVYHVRYGYMSVVESAGQNGVLLKREPFVEKDRSYIEQINDSRFSWRPPKKRRMFKFKGTVLPCPSQVRTRHTLVIDTGVLKSRFFFDSDQDVYDVRSALVDPLIEAQNTEDS